MGIILRIVAVYAALSVALTLWFIAAFSSIGGLRPLLSGGVLGWLTLIGWLVTLVLGPVAAIKLWRFAETGRRAAIVLFGFGLLYYVAGLLFLRGPGASVLRIAVAAALFAWPLGVLLSKRAQIHCGGSR